jgi:DAACS family dicarboxylate/amino acid:cation (Na+ or H+) symporter
MAADTAPGDMPPPRGGVRARWGRAPLYLRIVFALVLGVLVGSFFHLPVFASETEARLIEYLELVSKLILRLLSALAPPLILLAVVQALMKAEVRGKTMGRLTFLLTLNTLVAIAIGLLVANVIQPGRHANLEPAPKASLADKATDPAEKQVLTTVERYGFKPTPPRPDPLVAFLDNVPRSLAGPLADNGSVLSVILIAVAFGVALRRMRDEPVRTVGDSVDITFRALLTILHWIIAIVPLGVFGIVASIIGKEGFAPFVALGMFIVAVLLALFLQGCYYLTRIGIGSWVRPLDLVRGTRDALVMAFSTASSTATMPVTYARLRDNVGVRERSASMGALVGANFNNDGTALYEAMSALFISQLIGRNLSLGQQFLVALTSVAASVGAAGIPEAGLVTMTLVFNAVGLPVEYIALLLTVDWFLDRCRTAINVMGDMNVACLLDGKTRETAAEGAPEAGTGMDLEPAR